jgi:hypothetical protein
MSKRKKQGRARHSVRAAAIDPETGLTFAELERESRRRLAVAAANADPLPGPLSLAFPAKPIQVGAFAIRPFVHADWATLRHLDSPLLKQIAELRKPAAQRQPTTTTDQEEWEMILVFLLDPARALHEACNQRAAFAQFAREKIGLGLNPFLVEMLKGAVVKQFEISCLTAVEFAANTSAQSGNEFFTRPPAEPKTASAGGSSISAASSEPTHP